MKDTKEVRDVLQVFENIYGNTDRAQVFFAPGRVNLIGEHTDYNGGHVFPCALTMGTYAAARRREDKQLRLYSANRGTEGIRFFSLDDLRPSQDAPWTNYVRGVLWSMCNRNYEFETGFDMVVYGNIPSGAGLSSSASLEIVTGIMLTELYHLPTSGPELALIGQDAENNYCGLSCGIMDQFTSAMGEKGQALFLDTATLQYEYAPLPLDTLGIVLTDSHVKHSLVDSAYNERRAQCAEALRDLQSVTKIASLGELNCEQFEKLQDVIRDATCRRRAKHAVYENQRTLRAVEALRAGDLAAFGRLMNESHISLRDDYETSCPETDILAEEAWKLPGVLGSRITGGGFGGCTVTLLERESIPQFKETIARVYKEKTGIDCDFYDVEIGGGPERVY